MIELKISTSSRRIFKQVAVDTQGAYVLNGKAYTIVTPDFLYNVSAYDGAISQLVYTFDGVGGLVTSTGLSYTYVIQTQSDEDSVDNLYRLTITSADGTVYEGELDYGSSDYKLTLTAKN
jgi:hypothetical protein